MKQAENYVYYLLIVINYAPYMFILFWENSMR